MPAPPTTDVGSLDLRVQPADVEVRIDGQPWLSTDNGHFVVQLPVGEHRLELCKPGQFRLATNVVIGEGETNTLELNPR